MRVLIFSDHRYPELRPEGSGLRPRDRPSPAYAHVHDLLARGLAEEGHEVHYLLPAGADAPLPPEVRHATRVPRDVDVFHNLRLDGHPWVMTVHAYRPPAGYCATFGDGTLQPPRLHRDPPPYLLPANAICVSETLAQSFGSRRFVHNGLDPADYIYSAAKGDYFLYMAAMQGPAVADLYRAKGLTRALALAREVGFELVVAGAARDPNVSDVIAARCRRSGASYVGDVRGPRKAELLAGARALLFPVVWNEGFGLVMAEALLSGTPVICSDRGACPELITADVGFACSSARQFRHAIDSVGQISPGACRRKALRDFHYRRMAADYVREYTRELNGPRA